MFAEDLQPQQHTDPSMMSPGALAQCQYSSWYRRYAPLAPESEVIPLTKEFAAFLVEDGLVVADDSDAMPRRSLPPTGIIDEDDYSPEFPEEPGDAAAAAATGAPQPPQAAAPAAPAAAAGLPWGLRFPELRARIDATVARLGGAVAPKLNWSSPTDATFLSLSNSLRCCSAEQVVLLLKGSDRTAFDLQLAENLRRGAGRADVAPELVLRRWRDVRPECEFRCFLHAHRPVAVCQRDPSQLFPQLQAEAERLRVRDAVCGFHAEHFGRGFSRGSYTIDVYVPPSGPVWLLDVNPIADTTQPLLLDWQQLPYHAGAGDAGAGAEEDGEGQGQGRAEGWQLGGRGGGREEEEEGDNGAGGSDGDGGGGGDGDGDGEIPGDWGHVPIMVVEGQAPTVRPGVRQACGMPYDMLSLQQEGMDDVIRLMRQQQFGGDDDDDEEEEEEDGDDEGEAGARGTARP